MTRPFHGYVCRDAHKLVCRPVKPHVFEPGVVCAATLAAPMRAQLKATGPRADAPPASAPVILALAHLLFVVRAQDAVVE